MGRNKTPHISVRLTAEQYEWLINHASNTAQAKNDIFKQALDLYRKLEVQK